MSPYMYINVYVYICIYIGILYTVHMQRYTHLYTLPYYILHFLLYFIYPDIYISYYRYVLPSVMCNQKLYTHTHGHTHTKTYSHTYLVFSHEKHNCGWYNCNDRDLQPYKDRKTNSSMSFSAQNELSIEHCLAKNFLCPSVATTLLVIITDSLNFAAIFFFWKSKTFDFKIFIYLFICTSLIAESN